MAAEDALSSNLVHSSSHLGTDDTTSVDFVIPLSPFERILLDGIHTAYFSMSDNPGSLDDYMEISMQGEEGHSTSEQLVAKLGQLCVNEAQPPKALCLQSPITIADDDMYIPLFQGWVWASKVGRSISESQEGEQLKDFGGDRVQSFADTIHFLRSPYLMNTTRTSELLKHNTSVQDRLASSPVQFRFVPLLNDMPHWETLAVMNMFGHRTQLRRIGTEDNLWDNSKYEVWKVVQQFSLAYRRPDNVRKIINHLFSSTPFRNKFIIIKKAAVNSTGPVSRDIQVEILDRQKFLSSAELSRDRIIEDPRAAIKWLLGRSIEDPRDYLEIIPWEELKSITSTELKEVYPPLSHEIDTDQKWVLWKPPSQHFFDSHHLYTEPEVYQYCITNSWSFPGYSYPDGSVIFVLSPLEATQFVDDLKNFWERWVTFSSTLEIFI